MEFLKHKVGLILLILSLVVIVAVVWYLMFDMQGGGSYEGGTLVKGISDIPVTCVRLIRNAAVSL